MDRQGFLKRTAYALVLMLLLPGAAWAEKRVALIIGNNNYKAVPKLAKAVNDAESMEQELKRLGFNIVFRKNASRRDMNKAVNEFVDQLSGGDVAVLFYSGHGVQVQGANYLLPVDIEADREQDLQDEGIELGDILNRVAQTKAKFSMAIIDACRNNPFQKKGRSIGASRGLSTMSAPNGLMVIYSAGVNEQALDALNDHDDDPNGLFTREFIRLMNEPGLRIDDMVKKARAEVKKKAQSVGHQQNPAIYDQTDGEFYFKVGEAKASPKATATTAAVTTKHSGPSQYDETIFWQSAKETPEGCGVYLEKFPDGLYSGLAKICQSKGHSKPPVMETYRREEPAPAVAPPAPPPPPKAAEPSFIGKIFQSESKPESRSITNDEISARSSWKP
ncbi:MAG: caspase family protein [Magnetococcus sp. DMHC-1]|nr:caspase family protein [Magnetococcales bacterium]